MSYSKPQLADVSSSSAAEGSVSSLIRVLASTRNAQVHAGGPTIADIVLDEVRPMLKDWLDRNLPPLMERVVRAEIERVVAQAAD